MRIAKQQSGLVLIFTLIIVLVLTLSVVAGLRDSVSTQKMISSSNSYQYAFELAEATSIEVYDIIDNQLTDTSGFGTVQGYHNIGQAPDPFKAEWVSESATLDMWGITDPSLKPTYIVELMRPITQQDTQSLEIADYTISSKILQADVFRVVVQATDENGKSKQVIETFYAREFK